MKVARILGVVVLVVLIVALWPLLFIWSINTLFGTGIAYTWATWFAAIVLAIMLGAARNKT